MADQPEESGWRKAGELGDMGLRFALFLTLCVLGGLKLDERWGSRPWLTLAGALVGMAIGAWWAWLKLREMIGGGKS
jgi:hypothetical protein